MSTFLCNGCELLLPYSDLAPTTSVDVIYCKWCHADWAEYEFEWDVPSYISDRY